MNNAAYEKLQADVDKLRDAVESLEIARAADTTPEKLAELQRTVEVMALEMNAKMDEIRQALLGNNGSSTAGILTSLTVTVESMGRIIETLHREGQLKNDVLESIIPKLSLEKTWKDIALMWQNYAVRLSLTYDEAR